MQHTKECALTVKYPAKTVSYAGKDLEELELAYALTAHKCQGSEMTWISLSGLPVFCTSSTACITALGIL